MDGRLLRAEVEGSGPLGVEFVGFQRRAAERRRRGRALSAAAAPRVRKGDCRNDCWAWA